MFFGCLTLCLTAPRSTPLSAPAAALAAAAAGLRWVFPKRQAARKAEKAGENFGGHVGQMGIFSPQKKHIELELQASNLFDVKSGHFK